MLASAEAAGLALDHKRIDLGLVADQAADALEPQVDIAGLTLSRQVHPVLVLGDETRLHQIITNLLTNAIKFTPAGGCIMLTVVRRDRTAEIVVDDTGRGIPPEDISHIFARFWRGPTARQIAGSGIGLAVVREFVRAHGGDVTATSDEGHGTRVVVALPRA